MLKFFFNLSGGLLRPRTDIAWQRDPLSHPDIAAMDQRMLGDLPFSPVFPQAGEPHIAKVVPATRRGRQVPQKVWNTSSCGAGAAA